jgi:hypothetical protein
MADAARLLYSILGSSWYRRSAVILGNIRMARWIAVTIALALLLGWPAYGDTISDPAVKFEFEANGADPRVCHLMALIMNVPRSPEAGIAPEITPPRFCHRTVTPAGLFLADPERLVAQPDAVFAHDRAHLGGRHVPRNPHINDSWPFDDWGKQGCL